MAVFPLTEEIYCMATIRKKTSWIKWISKECW